MNDDELRERLGKLEVPDADPLARERALERARMAFGTADSYMDDEDSSPASFGFLQAMGVGLVAAALVIGLLHLSTVEAPENPAHSEALLRQFEVTFPEYLEAVIQRGDEVRVALADETRPPNGQRLQITFTDSGQPIRILSYSGEKVCIDLRGAPTCFEMLLTAKGEVIVVGNDFVWTPENPIRVSGYRLEAERLVNL